MNKTADTPVVSALHTSSTRKGLCMNTRMRKTFAAVTMISLVTCALMLSGCGSSGGDDSSSHKESDNEHSTQPATPAAVAPVVAVSTNGSSTTAHVETTPAVSASAPATTPASATVPVVATAPAAAPVTISVTPTPAATTAPAPDGAALYASNCQGCHGTSKRGKSAATIQAAINSNRGGMGSLSALTPVQIAAIAAW